MCLVCHPGFLPPVPHLLVVYFLIVFKSNANIQGLHILLLVLMLVNLLLYVIYLDESSVGTRHRCLSVTCEVMPCIDRHVDKQ